MPTHEDVEVGVVFLADKTAEKFFGRRRQVVFIADLVSGLSQHRNAFGELQSQRRVQELERLGRILLTDRLDLFVVPETMNVSINRMIPLRLVILTFETTVAVILSYVG